MPFIDGESLRDRLKRDGKLDAAEALHFARGVAGALDYAHRRGVVHRDIKPENILLSEGVALVADFGIAKAAREAGDAHLTQAGFAVGTPAYMSPEQIAGDELTGRSDIFSLGCVLFEMLSGEPVYSGPSAQAVLAKRFASTPPSLRTHRAAAALPDTVIRAVSKAMAPDPAERFETAAAFSAALDMPGTPLTPRAAGGKSIAVLPFANMSAEADNEYFSDGISEEIINVLTKVPSLRVAARTSSFAFKQKNEDVRVIGERLNVGAVLEGSVRRAGQRLRITAQLIDVADGYHLWSETYEREMHDVFAIQDEIARAIVETLKVKLFTGADGALVRPPTEHVEAYALYLKGRYYWNQRIESALTKGLECFEEAIAIDPEYVLAHVGVADSHNIFGFYDLRAPRESFPRAHEAARRALQMDPDCAPAHAAEGYALMYHEWDWAGAERALRRAIELDPRYSIAPFYLGNLLTIQGRFDEGAASMRRSIAIEPLSLIVNAAIGWIRFMAHDLDAAMQQYTVALDLNDRFLIAHWWKGLTLAERGDFAAGTSELERAVEISQRNPTMLASLARTHALAGRESAAREILRELEALASRRYVSSFELAVAHDALGERERAIALLQAAYEERSHSMAFLGSDPRLDRMRDDPRFAELRRLVRV
jgi:serine/threonine-protein kinase